MMKNRDISIVTEVPGGASSKIDIPKEVYCKNCIYFLEYGGWRYGSGYQPVVYLCFNTTFKQDFKGDIIYKDIPRADHRNINNNCKLYKRKWWKFWVR